VNIPVPDISDLPPAFEGTSVDKEQVYDEGDPRIFHKPAAGLPLAGQIVIELKKVLSELFNRY
jgi:hypothetical protein